MTATYPDAMGVAGSVKTMTSRDDDFDSPGRERSVETAREALGEMAERLDGLYHEMVRRLQPVTRSASDADAETNAKTAADLHPCALAAELRGIHRRLNLVADGMAMLLRDLEI